MIPITEAIERISKALERRSGRPWSVITGKLAGFDEWLDIAAPTERWLAFELIMRPEDRGELARLLHLREPVSVRGKKVPPEFREEYVRRAENENPLGDPTGPPGDTKCPGCSVILTAETIAYFEAKQSQDPPYVCADCRAAGSQAFGRFK